MRFAAGLVGLYEVYDGDGGCVLVPSACYDIYWMDWMHRARTYDKSSMYVPAIACLQRFVILRRLVSVDLCAWLCRIVRVRNNDAFELR